MKRSTGKVYLIGAGPGAPDLLTLRAAEILKRAAIVFHDALVHAEVLALAAGAEKIAVGKRCGRFATAQQFINKRLVDAARRHAVVVRLKGGDPMLFARAQEEISALRSAGIDFEIVPGVTSALAAAAEAGVSLTQRGAARSVAFVTARFGAGESEHAWVDAALAADTVVIYMGAGQADRIAATLIARGMAPDTPVAVVENASLPGARHMPMRLAELPQLMAVGLSGPAVIMIGRVFAAAQYIETYLAAARARAAN